MNFTIVTYWWGRGNLCENSKYNHFTNKVERKKTYDEIAKLWEDRMKRLKLNYYIEEKDEFTKQNFYQEALSYKPTFIQKCLKKFNTPIVYVDMDLTVHKVPYIFTCNYFDFIGINWNADIRVVNDIDFYTFETSSCVMYFNNTNGAKKLLRCWTSMFNNVKNRKMADDRVLAVCFQQQNFIHDIKCYWLPIEYYYHPEFYKNKIKETECVISHSYSITTEETAHKLGAAKNRIPTIYDKIIKSKSQWNLKEYCNFYFNKCQLNEYKQLNKLLKNEGKKYVYNKKFINQNSSQQYILQNSLQPKQLLGLMNEPYGTFSIARFSKQNYYDIIFDTKFNIYFVKKNNLTIMFLNSIPNIYDNISLILGLRLHKIS